MTRLPRPCLGAKNPTTGQHEDCGRPVTGGGPDKAARCARHAAMYEATRRPSPSARGYDREYRAEREEILRVRGECELRLPGCTGVATTLHHVVPTRGGRNVAAARQGPKIPACGHCNSSLGDKETPRPAAGGARGRGVSESGEDDDGWFPGP